MKEFTNRFLLRGEQDGKNENWMYALGLLVTFIGYFIFQAIMAIPLVAMAASNGIGMAEITRNPNILFDPEAIGINKSVLLALMMGMFVFALLGLWIAVKYIHQKTFASIVTAFDKIRWSRYFFAFALWGSLIIALTLVSYALSPEEMELRFDFSKFIILLVVAVIFVPIQTATEELIFRGYLMQAFSQYIIKLNYFSLTKFEWVELSHSFNVKLKSFSLKFFKNGIFPLIITSVLFGLMHGTNPEAKAHGLLLMLPYYIFFGMFLGMLTLLDEGLELAMGIHCANNLVSSLLITSKNSVLQTDAIFFTSVENPANEFLMWIAMASLCFFVFYKKYKLTNFKLLLR